MIPHEDTVRTYSLLTSNYKTLLKKRENKLTNYGKTIESTNASF